METVSIHNLCNSKEKHFFPQGAFCSYYVLCNLVSTSKISSGTAVFHLHKSFPFTKKRFEQEEHEVPFSPGNFLVE